MPPADKVTPLLRALAETTKTKEEYQKIINDLCDLGREGLLSKCKKPFSATIFDHLYLLPFWDLKRLAMSVLQRMSWPFMQGSSAWPRGLLMNKASSGVEQLKQFSTHLDAVWAECIPTLQKDPSNVAAASRLFGSIWVTLVLVGNAIESTFSSVFGKIWPVFCHTTLPSIISLVLEAERSGKACEPLRMCIYPAFYCAANFYQTKTSWFTDNETERKPSNDEGSKDIKEKSNDKETEKEKQEDASPFEDPELDGGNRVVSSPAPGYRNTGATMFKWFKLCQQVVDAHRSASSSASQMNIRMALKLFLLLSDSSYGYPLPKDIDAEKLALINTLRGDRPPAEPGSRVRLRALVGIFYYPAIIESLGSTIDALCAVPSEKRTKELRSCFRYADEAISEFALVRQDQRLTAFTNYWSKMVEFLSSDTQFFIDFEEETFKKAVQLNEAYYGRFRLSCQERFVKKRECAVAMLDFALKTLDQTYTALEQSQDNKKKSKKKTNKSKETEIEATTTTETSMMGMDIALRRAICHQLVVEVFESKFQNLITHHAENYISKHVVRDLQGDAPPALMLLASSRRDRVRFFSSRTPASTIRSLLSVMKDRILDIEVTDRESEEGKRCLFVRRMLQDCFSSQFVPILDNSSSLNIFFPDTNASFLSEGLTLQDDAMLAWVYNEVLGNDGAGDRFLMLFMDADEKEIAQQRVTRIVFKMISRLFEMPSLMPGMLDRLEPIVNRICDIAATFWIRRVGRDSMKFDSSNDEYMGAIDNRALRALTDIVGALIKAAPASMQEDVAVAIGKIEWIVAERLLKPLIEVSTKNNKGRLTLPKKGAPFTSLFAFYRLDDHEKYALVQLLKALLSILPPQPTAIEEQRGGVLFRHPEAVFVVFKFLFVDPSTSLYDDCDLYIGHPAFLISGGQRMLDTLMPKKDQQTKFVLKNLERVRHVLDDANSAAEKKLMCKLAETFWITISSHSNPSIAKSPDVRRAFLRPILFEEMLGNDGSGRHAGWRVFWTGVKLDPVPVLTTAFQMETSWLDWWDHFYAARIDPSGDVAMLERVREAILEGQFGYETDFDDENGNFSDEIKAKKTTPEAVSLRMKIKFWTATHLMSYKVCLLGVCALLNQREEDLPSHLRPRLDVFAKQAVGLAKRIKLIEDFRKEQLEAMVSDASDRYEKIREQNELKRKAFLECLDLKAKGIKPEPKVKEKADEKKSDVSSSDESASEALSAVPESSDSEIFSETMSASGADSDSYSETEFEESWDDEDDDEDEDSETGDDDDDDIPALFDEVESETQIGDEGAPEKTEDVDGQPQKNQKKPGLFAKFKAFVFGGKNAGDIRIGTSTGATDEKTVEEDADDSDDSSILEEEQNIYDDDTDDGSDDDSEENDEDDFDDDDDDETDTSSDSVADDLQVSDEDETRSEKESPPLNNTPDHIEELLMRGDHLDWLNPNMNSVVMNLLRPMEYLNKHTRFFPWVARRLVGLRSTNDHVWAEENVFAHLHSVFEEGDVGRCDKLKALLPEAESVDLKELLLLAPTGPPTLHELALKKALQFLHIFGPEALSHVNSDVVEAMQKYLKLHSTTLMTHLKLSLFRDLRDGKVQPIKCGPDSSVVSSYAQLTNETKEKQKKGKQQKSSKKKKPNARLF